MKTYIYARKFAQALLMIESEVNTTKVVEELSSLSQEWSQLDMYIPMYLADNVKKERIQQLGILSSLQKLILELSRCGKMRLLPRIAAEYIELNNKKQNICLVHVTSKRKLTKNERDTLEHVLEEKHNKKIVFKESIDPNVIDGLKIEVDYRVFDDTVATKIELLIQKISYEMEAV